MMSEWIEDRGMVIGILAEKLDRWPDEHSLCHNNQYWSWLLAREGIAWCWSTKDRARGLYPLLVSSAGEVIGFSDYLQARYKRRVERNQGNPNAHESVRCEVEVGGDASGAEVKRAIGDAVKASEKPAEWDGVGVPPAGTLIELLSDMQHHSSRKVVVVGFDSTLKRVVFRDLDWSDLEYDSALLDRVRPIRSEREKAVEEMMQEAGYSASDCYVSDYYVVASVVEAIYDAGYRKTEGV